MSDIIKLMNIIFFLLFSAILLENASALGVIPARTIIDFEPGVQHEFTLKVLNNQQKEMDVIISKQGQLSSYVKLSADTIKFSADEKEKYLQFSVDLPQNIETPGNNDIEIILTEVPASLEQKDSTIVSGRTSVISQLRVKVPYPGKYAEAKMHVSTSNDIALITIPISNLGSQNLEIISMISIFDKDKLLHEEIKKIEIEPSEEKSITASWSAPSIGLYRAAAEISYHGETINLEKEFIIGEMFVKIDGITFGDVKLGDILKISINVKNGWNEPIKGIYADVFVKDEQKNTVAVLKTASEDIGALSNKTLVAYWGTEKVTEGIYELIVKLNYAGKSSESSTEIGLHEDILVKPGATSPPIRIYIIVIAVSFLILAAFIYFKRSRK